MARAISIEEEERRLLLRLVGEEWTRLDQIRHARYFTDDPILEEQEKIEELLVKLR